ncbi:MAG: TMEM43 family protein [Luteimonas sp.]|nr:TMEM43 family protein [Luteimonas sp.]
MQLHRGRMRAPGDGSARTRLRCAALLLCALAWLPLVSAQAGAGGEGTAPHGEARVGKMLRDADFGVTTRHAGLQRHVEMYQWTRADSGYALEWRGARVDSSGFAPGHENPREMPLREREWRASVSIDGRPVSEKIVAVLGKWQPFRPNFSALPGNMSATFQPEGDGLGSAENPLAPQVGDLRVTWRAFVLPPLADRLALEDGVWILHEPAAAPSAADPDPQVDVQPESRHRSKWAALAAAIVVLLGLVVAVRRRRRSRPGS